MLFYTVILARPAYLITDAAPDPVFMACVKADSYKEAIDTARDDARQSDIKHGLAPRAPGDYIFSILFRGHKLPIRRGFKS